MAIQFVQVIGSTTRCTLKEIIYRLLEDGYLMPTSTLVSEGRPGIQLLAEQFWQEKFNNFIYKTAPRIDVVICFGASDANHSGDENTQYFFVSDTGKLVV